MPSEDSWDMVVEYLKSQRAIIARGEDEATVRGWQGLGKQCADTIWQALKGACVCSQSQDHTGLVK